MERRWIDFLRTPDDAGHAVQIYSEVEEIAESVAAYLATGFAAGDPAVVIATRDHQTVFDRFLVDAGWDPVVLVQGGLLTQLDADEMLAAVSEDGVVSASRFETVIGGVIDGIAERFPGRHMRAIGEMVDVLTARGKRGEAAELEILWDALAQDRRFSLLCGYQLDVFDLFAQTATLPIVCGAHTHVRPVYDLARLERAVYDALDDVLGASSARAVQAIVRDDVQGRVAPLPEQVLLWISHRMPRHAQRVLAEARTNYEALGASTA